ncbi:MAG: hypothetical protein FWF67_01855 [Fibromonadales bacterium]|nr:hypothetical protein [Fibromonadales bacterium]
MANKLTKLALAVSIGLASVFIFSCSMDSLTNTLKEMDKLSSSEKEKDGSSSSGKGGGSNANGSCDISDYRIVQICNQWWTAENLNYDVPGSVCYDNNPANCTKYGRLYDWATAMALPDSCFFAGQVSCTDQVQPKHRGICPAGWHIPSDADWFALQNCAGGDEIASTKLSARSGWDGGLNGTDTYGFAALPGGHSWGGGRDGTFLNVGIEAAYWWVGLQYRSVYCLSLHGSSSGFGYCPPDIGRYGHLNSVRCVKD